MRILTSWTALLYSIDKGILAEIKPNGTDKVRAYSLDLQDYAEFGLNEEDKPKASWSATFIEGARWVPAVMTEA